MRNQIDLHQSRNGNGAPSIDRLPPHTEEAERAVIGCILIDGNQCLPDCIERFKSGYEVFYDLRHQEIYKIFLELYEDNIPIDVITVHERLSVWDKVEQAGGLAYVSGLPDCVPSILNLPHYIDLVAQKNTLRRMLRACTDTACEIYDCQGDADELLDKCERDILQISESRVEPASMTMHSLVCEVMQDIENAHANEGVINGVETGFAELDQMTGGMHAGEMIVIAARPAMGKTSLAINIAEHVACNLHLPVGICSLEMTGKSLVNRMLCSRARVNLRNVREGFIAERDHPKLICSAGNLTHAPIYIDDTGGQSILQIRAKFRRWWQQHGIKLGIIDYLQLANALGGKRKFESRQQEVSEISCGIKNLAKELGIPIIALSQMNREFEREKNRRPRLADLRESGSIEQDADVIGFLYNPKKDNEDDTVCYEAVPVNLLIAKQRNGPTGDIALTFLKGFTRFESAAKVSDEDVPAAAAAPSLPYLDQ